VGGGPGSITAGGRERTNGGDGERFVGGQKMAAFPYALGRGKRMKSSRLRRSGPGSQIVGMERGKTHSNHSRLGPERPTVRGERRGKRLEGRKGEPHLAR